MEKVCTLCKELKNLSCFSKAGRKDALRSNCKTCDAKKYKEWKTKNRAAYLRSTSNAGLKIKYGIELKDYENLLIQQNYCCKICKTKNPGRTGVKRFAVDHCHKTNKVRGLLCMACNTAIGLLNENLSLFDAAKKYLEQHQGEYYNQIDEFSQSDPDLI
jgi:hypothetical protein